MLVHLLYIFEMKLSELGYKNMTTMLTPWMVPLSLVCQGFWYYFAPNNIAKSNDMVKELCREGCTRCLVDIPIIYTRHAWYLFSACWSVDRSSYYESMMVHWRRRVPPPPPLLRDDCCYWNNNSLHEQHLPDRLLCDLEAVSLPCLPSCWLMHWALDLILEKRKESAHFLPQRDSTHRRLPFLVHILNRDHGGYTMWIHREATSG